jgi:hypothetical protein
MPFESFHVSMHVIWSRWKTKSLRIVISQYQRILSYTAQHQAGPYILFQKWIELEKCCIGYLIRGSHRHEEVLFFMSLNVVVLTIAFLLITIFYTLTLKLTDILFHERVESNRTETNHDFSGSFWPLGCS